MFSEISFVYVIIHLYKHKNQTLIYSSFFFFNKADLIVIQLIETPKSNSIF